MKYNIPLSYTKIHKLIENWNFKISNCEDQSLRSLIEKSLDKDSIKFSSYGSTLKNDISITLLKNSTLHIERIDSSYGSISQIKIIIHKGSVISIGEKEIITKKDYIVRVSDEDLNELIFEFENKKPKRTLHLWHKPGRWGNRPTTFEFKRIEIVCSNRDCGNSNKPTKDNFCNLCGSETIKGKITYTNSYSCHISSKDKWVEINNINNIVFKKYQTEVATFSGFRSPYLIYCTFEIDDKIKKFPLKWNGLYDGIEIKNLEFQIYKLSRNIDVEKRYTNLEDYDLIETKQSYTSALNFCKEHINL